MADVAKRCSIFISNVPASASAASLKAFLLQELNSSQQDRSRLVHVIFPVSSANPRLALGTFLDEKVMVALLRKRLLFDGQVLTTQPFLSHVFSSMVAVMNPEVEELFPFATAEFSQTLKKHSGVECHQLDSNALERMHGLPQGSCNVLTGNWYQLQNARKFLHGWVVDQGKTCVRVQDGIVPSHEGAATRPRGDASSGDTTQPEEIRGIDSDFVQGSRSAEGPSAKAKSSSTTDTGGAVNGSLSSTTSQNSYRMARQMASVTSLERQSTRSEVVNNHGEPEVDGYDEADIEMMPHDRIPMISRNPPSESTSRRGEGYRGQVHPIESSEQSVRHFSLEPVGPSVVSARGVACNFSSSDLPPPPMVGPGLNYMEQVCNPPASSSYGIPTSSEQRNKLRSSSSAAAAAARRNPTESSCATSDIPPVERKVGDDPGAMDGSGSLPVDPGVFGYILLKCSESISTIEQRCGVRFSLQTTRDDVDSDAESALLNIVPQRDAADIPRAHDEFVKLYSRVFSSLSHRVIDLDHSAIDQEWLSKTMEKIHELYTTVLLTLSQNKVLIYGSSENDISLAKAWIMEALKGDHGTDVDDSHAHPKTGINQPPSEREMFPRDQVEIDGVDVEISGSTRLTDGLSDLQNHEEVDSPSASGRTRPQSLIINGSTDRGEVSREYETHTERFIVRNSGLVDKGTNDNGKGRVMVEEVGGVQLEASSVQGSRTSQAVDVRDSDGGHPAETDVETEIIPVDPGVLAYIQSKQQTTLSNIESNYCIKFKVQGNPNSDVPLIEVVPDEAAGGTESAIQGGKEAFVNFYTEVFADLSHRQVNLENFQSLSRTALEEIVQDVQHSFSDLLIKIHGSKILLYGPGLNNVETAQGLVLRHLQRGLMSPGAQESVSGSDMNVSLESSLSPNAMIGRLNHLRYDAEFLETSQMSLQRNEQSSAYDRQTGRISGDSAPQSPGRNIQLNGRLDLTGLPSIHDIDSSTTKHTTTYSMLEARSVNSFNFQPKSGDETVNGPASEGLKNATYRYEGNRLVVNFSSGFRVQVYQADITQIFVDVIVSAANARLTNTGGVAADIVRAAGHQLQADCNRHIARHGILYPSKVIQTGAGMLPFKFVLHAVGPCWVDSRDEQICRQTLATTVIKCLRMANEKLQVESIAMPLISSGVFGVPLDVCVEAITTALTDFNQHLPASAPNILQDVHIVDLYSASIREVQEVMIKMLFNQGVKKTKNLDAMSGRQTASATVRVRESENGLHLGSNEPVISSRITDEATKNQTRSSRSTRRQLVSVEDQPHERSLMSLSRPVMARSSSVPHLPGEDDADDAELRIWKSSDSEKSAFKGQTDKINSSGGSRASRYESEIEEQLQSIIHVNSRTAPSPELARRTQTKIDRIFLEEKERKRPAKRTQSLDRSTRIRGKCFICSSQANLSPRKSCQHLICKVCKVARLDAGSCRECPKAKSKGKRCDLCDCSNPKLLLNCKSCENFVCRGCVKMGLTSCAGCQERGPSWAAHADRKPPPMREPIVASRKSRLDTKTDYRIKPSVPTADAINTRRAPMLGLNRPVASAYSCSSSDSGPSRASSSARSSPLMESAPIVAPAHQGKVHGSYLPKEKTARHRDILERSHTPVSTPSSSSSRGSAGNHPTSRAVAVASKEKGEYCVICMDRLQDPGTLSKRRHTLYTPFIEQSLQYEPLCSNCRLSSGQLHGDQPRDGRMEYATVSSDLPGYRGFGTIVITYSFPDGFQTEEHRNPHVPYRGTHREAYLPNNSEGQEVLKLLRKAFDARLVFTIDSSITRGGQNVVVWNDIHHKTRQTGGPDADGYPDPSYLQRVKMDLAAKGIK